MSYARRVIRAVSDPVEMRFYLAPDAVPREYPDCRVYWGSHGCHRRRGHPGHHLCDCECVDHARDHETEGCVCAWPYYGWPTGYYGEDVSWWERFQTSIVRIRYWRPLGRRWRRWEQRRNARRAP